MPHIDFNTSSTLGDRTPSRIIVRSAILPSNNNNGQPIRRGHPLHRPNRQQKQRGDLDDHSTRRLGDNYDDEEDEEDDDEEEEEDAVSPIFSSYPGYFRRQYENKTSISSNFQTNHNSSSIHTFFDGNLTVHDGNNPPSIDGASSLDYRADGSSGNGGVNAGTSLHNHYQYEGDDVLDEDVCQDSSFRRQSTRSQSIHCRWFQRCLFFVTFLLTSFLSPAYFCCLSPAFLRLLPSLSPSMPSSSPSSSAPFGGTTMTIDPSSTTDSLKWLVLPLTTSVTPTPSTPTINPPFATVLTGNSTTVTTTTTATTTTITASNRRPLVDPLTSTHKIIRGRPQYVGLPRYRSAPSIQISSFRSAPLTIGGRPYFPNPNDKSLEDYDTPDDPPRYGPSHIKRGGYKGVNDRGGIVARDELNWTQPIDRDRFQQQLQPPSTVSSDDSDLLRVEYYAIAQRLLGIIRISASLGGCGLLFIYYSRLENQLLVVRSKRHSNVPISSLIVRGYLLETFGWLILGIGFIYSFIVPQRTAGNSSSNNSFVAAILAFITRRLTSNEEHFFIILETLGWILLCVGSEIINGIVMAVLTTAMSRSSLISSTQIWIAGAARLFGAAVYSKIIASQCSDAACGEDPSSPLVVLHTVVINHRTTSSFWKLVAVSTTIGIILILKLVLLECLRKLYLKQRCTLLHHLSPFPTVKDNAKEQKYYVSNNQYTSGIICWAVITSVAIFAVNNLTREDSLHPIHSDQRSLELAGAGILCIWLGFVTDAVSSYIPSIICVTSLIAHTAFLQTSSSSWLNQRTRIILSATTRVLTLPLITYIPTLLSVLFPILTARHPLFSLICTSKYARHGWKNRNSEERPNSEIQTFGSAVKDPTVSAVTLRCIGITQIFSSIIFAFGTLITGIDSDDTTSNLHHERISRSAAVVVLWFFVLTFLVQNHRFHCGLGCTLAMPASKLTGTKQTHGDDASQSVALPVKEPGSGTFHSNKKKHESSFTSSSSSSKSSHDSAVGVRGGVAPPSGLGSLWPRHKKDRDESLTDSSRSSGITFGHIADIPRAKVGAPSAARQYEFEWQEPSFFKPDVNQPLLEADEGICDPSSRAPGSPTLRNSVGIDTDTGVSGVNTYTAGATSHLKFGDGLGTTTTPGFERTCVDEKGGESISTMQENELKEDGMLGLKRERGNTREANALRLWALNLRLEKYVLMEVAWGAHQLVEMSAAEVIKRVRMHGAMSTGNRQNYCTGSSQARDRSMEKTANLMKRKPIVGEITYRDIRQVFSDTQQNPSLEIRRNCIILCLPPLTALVFHDRCVFLVNDEIDVDSLILRLEDITETYSTKAEETERFFLESTDDGAIFDTVAVASEEPTTISIRNTTGAKGMLLSAQDKDESNEKADGIITTDQNSMIAPRFVLFPLEFAILEILISCAFEAINADLEVLEKRQERVKDKVKQERQPSHDRLEELHEIKAPVESFADKMGSLSKAFKELLSSPEDMIYMELTKLYYKPHLYYKRLGRSNNVVNPNLEILLEFFDQEVEQFERRAHMMLRNVENAERYVNLKMALTRNELVYWDLTSTILTVGLGGGACIGGIFGMNLQSGMEENPWLFYFFTGTILISCASGLIAIAILRHKYR